MKLHLVSRDAWTVLAVYDTEERCALVDFVHRLRRDDPSEFRRLAVVFDRLARCGPSRDLRHSRNLGSGILELKTRGGVRIPYFYDEGRVVICTEALQKPKQGRLNMLVQRAEQARWRYFSDKRRGMLEIVED